MNTPVEQTEQSSTPTNQPGLWKLFCLWLLIGVQSFGGGVATESLIRQTAVDREGWITDELFLTNFWN